MFFIFVNGNQVHDEGERDAQGRVVRKGGGVLSFEHQAEAVAAADALYAAHVEGLKALRGRRLALSRDHYVVATEPPLSLQPEEAIDVEATPRASEGSDLTDGPG